MGAGRRGRNHVRAVEEIAQRLGGRHRGAARALLAHVGRGAIVFAWADAFVFGYDRERQVRLVRLVCGGDERLRVVGRLGDDHDLGRSLEVAIDRTEHVAEPERALDGLARHGSDRRLGAREKSGSSPTTSRSISPR